MILVVDDTPANIDIILSILGDDYEVAVALSGEDALEIVEDEIPSLILLDIIMPGMDGFEVCRVLKARSESKDVPVLFLSGNSSQEDQDRAKSLGAVGFISKPIDPSLLKERVKEFI